MRWIKGFILVLMGWGTGFAVARIGDFTHEWAVQINGGDDIAAQIAQENNFDIVDKVRGTTRVYFKF